MKKKLLIAGHDLKFFTLILQELKKSNKYDIKVDEWKGHAIHDISESQKYLEWADIIFCEWGLGNAVWYSHRKRVDQKLIIRMHSQETRAKYWENFFLGNINEFIVITPYMFEKFHHIFNIPRKKLKMIYNMVETEKYNLPKIL